ncbi:hypothetical protein ASE49_12335 [Novosphingobium sp. Leaf2]|nr:hypothetical protein ASE49_12335 [Novosphingobium sp. Leaf2]
MQAVHGLIEDFDTVTAPEKLQALVNTAFKGLPASATRQPLALAADNAHLAPKGGGKPTIRANAGHGGRQPLALPADRGFPAPNGD